MRGGSLRRREPHRGGVGGIWAATVASGGRLGQRGRRRAAQNALQRPFARFEEDGPAGRRTR